jgi:putative alpha-1,2-mannosidase
MTTVMKNYLQETNNHPTHVAICNKSEARRHRETEGNAKHERKDPASLQIFFPRVRNMQRLTATVEQAVNRLNYKSNQGHKKVNNKQTGILQINNGHAKRDES